MKVFVQGSTSSLSLTKGDYVGQGGEGTIYAKGNTAFKIYTDPQKMIPVGKVTELSAIQDPHVIRPDKIIYDIKKNPIGYTMRFVKGGYVLCQLFPRTFRDRNGLTPNGIQDLVRQFQESIQGIHQTGILLVDLNEMNFMVDKGFGEILCIDVDSYQTKDYPAKVLMPSVRDWSCGKKFSTMSDWFSFGVVTFQMFMGIHPFKGKHPGFSGPDKLTERMKAGVSIFDPQVRVPKAAYPMSVIPKAYLPWYKALFVEGKRCAPPDLSGIMIVVQPQVRSIQGTDNFEIKVLAEYTSDIRQVWPSKKDQSAVVVAEDGIYHTSFGGSSRSVRLSETPDNVYGIAEASLSGKPVLARGVPGEVPTLYSLQDRKEIPFFLKVDDLVAYRGDFYYKLRDAVYCIELHSMGDQILPTTKEISQVMEMSSKLYPGVIVQNMLGSVYLNTLSPTGSRQFRAKELDAYKIVDAKADGTALMFIGVKDGNYDRIILRLGEGETYDVRIEEDISYDGLNFITLDSGVVLCINEAEEVELFRSRPQDPLMKKIKDPMVGGDMALSVLGGKAVFSRGRKVYSIKSK